jgi:glycosyltransferase involved in cell wall biosynthesis
MPGLSDDGGAEHSFAAMAPLIRQQGVELHLALLTPRQDLVAPLEAAGVRIHDLSSERHLVGRVRSLRGLIRLLEPDVVHATLFDATLPTELASIGSKAPMLVSWASTTYGPDRLAEPGVRPGVIHAYRLAEMALGRLSGSWYHAVTEGVGRCNGEALRVPRSRVLVGERGRDPARFSPAGRIEAPGGEGTRRILAVGRQEPVKGYERLLRAFEHIADELPEVKLTIVGREGGATDGLRRYRDGMRHRDRVEFAGQRDDVHELMRDAAVVVCSSWREGASGAVIEAMAAGVPVVTVRLAGLEGVAVDGVNAVVVEPDALAEGVLRVLTDGRLAAELGAGGRRTFLDRFTLQRAAERMVEIYRTVGGSKWSTT